MTRRLLVALSGVMYSRRAAAQEGSILTYHGDAGRSGNFVVPGLTAIARGFLKPEDSNQAWSVIESVYATQLSDRTLNWLTDNAVIIPEQRSNAAAILRCISDWLDRATA